jgi:hypothetical protein
VFDVCCLLSVFLSVGLCIRRYPVFGCWLSFIVCCSRFVLVSNGYLYLLVYKGSIGMIVILVVNGIFWLPRYVYVHAHCTLHIAL